MNTFYTYIYKDPSRNNHVIYVGKGQGKRAYEHRFRKDKHPFVQRLQKMKKNGVEPLIEFLCENVDEELALLCEIEAIDLYGRKDLGKGSLLNLTDGGEGHSGYVQSTNTRLKRSASLKNVAKTEEHKAAIKLGIYNSPNKPGVPVGHKQTVEHRNNLSAARIGEEHSAQHNAKVSAALTGRKQSPEHAAANRKPCTVDGVTIYPSLIELTRALGRGKNGSRSPTFSYIKD